MLTRLVGMLAITGALTGYFVSITLPHRYVARTTLKVIRPANLTKENYDEDAHRMVEVAAEQVLSPEVLASLINHDSRLREMLMLEPMPELSAKIRHGSRIYATSLPGGVNGITVEYEDEEAEPALDINRGLTALVARVATGAAHYGEKGEATETAEAPHAVPTGATLPLSTGIGFAVGMALGLIAAAFGKSAAGEPASSAPAQP